MASARQAWGLTGSVTGPRIGVPGGADEPPRVRHRLGRVVSIARCGAAADHVPPLLVIARHEPPPRRTCLGRAGPPRRTARVPRRLGRGGERVGVRTGAVRPATGHGLRRRLQLQRLDAATAVASAATATPSSAARSAARTAAPPGTLTGGWWKVDGSGFCGGGARYYVDCNAPCGPCGCGVERHLRRRVLGHAVRLRARLLQQPQGRLHRLPLRPVQPARRLPRSDRVPGRHLRPAVADRRGVRHGGAGRQRHA